VPYILFGKNVHVLVGEGHEACLELGGGQQRARKSVCHWLFLLLELVPVLPSASSTLHATLQLSTFWVNAHTRHFSGA
jgi:hypothetical protein